MRTKPFCHSFKTWHSGLWLSPTSFPVPSNYHQDIFTEDCIFTLGVDKQCSAAYKPKPHWNPTNKHLLHMIPDALCLRRRAKECDRDWLTKTKILSGVLKEKRDIQAFSLANMLFNTLFFWEPAHSLSSSSNITTSSNSPNLTHASILITLPLSCCIF